MNGNGDETGFSRKEPECNMSVFMGEKCASKISVLYLGEGEG